MRIRFVKAWKWIKEGRVIEMPGGQADMMIRRGFAVEEPEIETAMRAPQERAVRKRGRARQVSPSHA